MSSNWFKNVALTAALLCAFPALAATVTVNSQGIAHTRELARAEALRDAIMQVTGVSINTETVQHLVSDQITTNDKEQTTIRAQQEHLFRDKIQGVVTGFRVIQESKTPDGMISLKLEVDIEKYETPGVQSNRRSISGQGFEVLKNGVCFGRKLSSSEMVNAVTDAVQRALVTTRKFAILDRHGNAYDLEKKFIQGKDVKLSEKAKLGLNRGSDFVVSGKIRHLSIGDTIRKLQLSDRVQVNRHARADIGFELMMFDYS